ncbi:MAG: von Willebrand factor type A domain-containing protein [Prosthecobacter sp.]|uniref:YfbK domain-containing protein n=1 Tax=Prosthecobacter sp. TaxID=1965333 RepID=UPI003BAE895C
MKPEQITAWALDEASTEERQQLEAALLENPQDKEKADATKAFCDFLLSELRDDSLALTDKQRERLVAQAAKPQAVEPSSQVPAAGAAPAQTPAASGKPGKTTRWNIGVIVRLSLAACAVLGGFWTWQVYSSRRSEVRAVAAVAEKPGIKVQLAPKPEAKKKAGQGPEARLLAATPVKPVIVAEQPAAKTLSPMPKSAPVAAVSALAVNKDQRAMSPGDVERLKRVQDENAYGLSFGGGLKTPDAVGLVVAGTGMTSQKLEPVAAGAALGLANGSVQVAGGDARMPVDAGRLTVNGGSALTVGAAVSDATGSVLKMIPDAKDLLKQTEERQAASLSLKGGYFPNQSVVHGLAPDVMEIDGLINLYVPTLDNSSLNRIDVVGKAPVAPPRVTAQKTGLAYGLLPGVHLLRMDGWPPMPQANPSVLAAFGDLDEAGSLAEYQPGVDMGDLRLPQGSYNTRGGAWLMLTAANASTGSITVQAGMPYMMNAFMRSLEVNVFDDLLGASAGNLKLDPAYLSVPVGGITIDPWVWMQSNPNAKSAGLISFAAAANSQLKAAHDSDSIAAADQQLLGGLLRRDQRLSGSAAALADSSRLSEMQAAVFNASGLREGVDLIGAPVVRTKSGTGATMDVTREFYSAGSIEVPNKSNFKFDGSSAAAFADAPAAQAGMRKGAGALIANGNVVKASPTQGMETISFTGEVVMISGQPYPVVIPVKPSGVKIFGPTTAATRAEPTLTFGSTSAQPGYIATAGTAGAGTTLATTSSGSLQTNSLTVGNVVSATPMTKTAPVVRIREGIRSYMAADRFIIGDTYNNSAVSPAPAQAVANTLANTVSATPRENETAGAITSGSGAMTKTGAGVLVLGGANTYSGGTTINGGTLSVSNGAAMPSRDAFAPLMDDQGQMKRNAGVVFNNNGGAVAGAAPAAAPASPPAGVVGGSSTTARQDVTTFTTSAAGVQNPQAAALGGNASSTTAAPASPATFNSTAAVAMDLPMVMNPTQAAAAYDPQRSKMLAQVSESWESKVPLLVQSGQVVLGKDGKTDDFYLVGKATAVEEISKSPSQPGNGESYTRIIENELKDVAREPLSTLSIDVDTASYANVRRFLNQNMIPPPDAVRIEELVNYFPTAEEGPAHDAKEPFGVRVELAPCPWQPVHRLARIAIKGREMDKDRKASNLVFLVDVSGSMNEPAKLPLVQQSLRMLTEQLGEGDRVTMVVYAGSSGVVLPPTSGEKKEEILGAINRLQAGGSTHGSAGIKLAYEQAVAGFIKGGVNRVILCTDGDFNVGVSSPEELEKLIKHKAKSGVFLSVLGFGSGNLKDRTMETLADKGNGNYAYIDSLSEARKVLVEQMSGTLVTIAKDVKIQVEFNPAAVRSYRLIGYENRLLAKEDFNDDTKDAGEIGAGHSVVALYEIVPANLPAGAEGRPAVDSLKYQAPAISPAQLAEAAKSGEMMTVKLRYKEPESDLSKLIEVPTKDDGRTLTASSEEYKFSAAVAGFGLLLRDSSYKGSLSWETVRRLALDGKGADKQGHRGEFLQLIDKARGLKGEK